MKSTSKFLSFFLVTALCAAAEAYEMKMMMMAGKGKGGSTMMSGSSSKSSMAKGTYSVSTSSSSYKGTVVMMKQMMMMKSDSSSHSSCPMTQIDLGAIRPEGVTAGPGDILYVSELFYGGVKAVNVVTGEVSQAVPSAGYFVRAAIGLWYAADAMFVAGGGSVFGVPAAVYVYGASDGSELAACTPNGAGFLNDLIVYEGTLYVTDSLLAQLFVFDVSALLDGKCDYSTIALPNSFTGPGFPYANGIEVYKDGLIIANVGGDPSGSDPDAPEIVYVDLKTGEMTVLVTGGAGDGLYVDGDILYAVVIDRVDVYKLDYSKKMGVTAELLTEISSDMFRYAATIAPYKNMLYLTNAVRIICIYYISPTGVCGSHSHSLLVFYSALTLELRPMERETRLHFRMTLICFLSLLMFIN